MVRRTVPAAFTASETFDVGVDTSLPVASDYFAKPPEQDKGPRGAGHPVTLKQILKKSLRPKWQNRHNRQSSPGCVFDASPFGAK